MNESVKTLEQIKEDVNQEIKEALAAGTMTKAEQAINGGIDRDTAFELFGTLSTKEALEVLECDIYEGDQCILLVEYPYVEVREFYVDCRSIKLDKENKTIALATDKDTQDHHIKLTFTEAYVYPGDDYNTEDCGSLNYNNSKEYDLQVFDRRGTLEGHITLIF